MVAKKGESVYNENVMEPNVPKIGGCFLAAMRKEETSTERRTEKEAKKPRCSRDRRENA